MPILHIKQTYSSIDGLLWDEDSRYFYYLHGPLARVEYGEDKVQGQDYVYTLQGWLKAVNFKGEDAINIEPGIDGNININAHSNKLMGRDAYGYVLGYNDEDYTAINANNYNFGLDWDFLGQEVLGIGNKKGLYNGNIATMATDLKGLVNEPLTAYAYKYDQLNRIKKANNAGLLQGVFLFRDSYSSQYNYDKDGNITTLQRYGSNHIQMDNLQYNYSGGNTNSSNKLIGITDAVSSSNFPNDLENTQYTYDAIGNLLTDSHEGLSVGWDVFNKIKSIYLPNKEIYYEYDPNGNRALKVRVGLPGTMNEGDCTEYYVRDPQGNILSIYSKKSEINEPLQSEVNLYGSNRLGSYKVNRQGFANEPYLSIQDAYRYRTQKYYELSNHLGNVLTTISDRKLGYNTSGSSAEWYEPEILTATDYDPFGMQLDDRQLSASNYRFGFNGKENDNDIKGDGNQQDYGMRIYDPRVGRFLSVDPLTKNYPWNSTYAFSENSPIANIDLDGAERYYAADGTKLGSIGSETKVMRVDKNNIQEAIKYIEWANAPNSIEADANRQFNIDQANKLSIDVGMNEDELNTRAFMSTLKQTENAGNDALPYNSLHGFKKGKLLTFTDKSYKDAPEDYTEHPYSSKRTKSGTASGAYQILKYSWKNQNDPIISKIRDEYSISDFSPVNQDKMVLGIIDIKRKALEIVKFGQTHKAINLLKSEWSSLPGGSQSHLSLNIFDNLYKQNISNELNDKSNLAVPKGETLNQKK